MREIRRRFTRSCQRTSARATKFSKGRGLLPCAHSGLGLDIQPWRPESAERSFLRTAPCGPAVVGAGGSLPPAPRFGIICSIPMSN
jgi:hypothetical protein